MEPTERSGRFVIERHRKGLRRGFWVRSVASNGETLSHSEMLTSRAAAEKNIEAQRQLVDAPVEDKT